MHEIGSTQWQTVLDYEMKWVANYQPKVIYCITVLYCKGTYQESNIFIKFISNMSFHSGAYQKNTEVTRLKNLWNGDFISKWYVPKNKCCLYCDVTTLEVNLLMYTVNTAELAR